VNFADLDQAVFLRALKGAPASIVLALVFTGLSLSNKELELATGYSGKSIAKGLALLELHKVVQNNGRANGWSVRNDFQLGLFPAALLGGDKLKIEDGVMMEGGRRIETSAAEPGAGGLSNFERRKFSGLGNISSSTDLDDLRYVEKAEETEEKAGIFPGSEVRKWLLKAGVGRKSKKMRVLVGMNMEVNYVKAWVLEFIWWKKKNRMHPGQSHRGREQFSVGTLIRILEDEDPAPPMRCEECLGIMPCLCEVVRR